MSKSANDIKTLVGELSLGLHDSTLLNQFALDVLERISILREPAFLKKADVSVSSGTATYNYPTDAFQIVASIMGDSLLAEESEASFNAYKTTWKSDAGTPKAIYEDKLSRKYSLYPKPNFTSGDLLYLFYAENRTDNIQDFYALPIAMYILAKIFTHSSNNQDPDLAVYSLKIADILMGLLGHHDILKGEK